MGKVKKFDIYDNLYDYDDLKIALCVSDYLSSDGKDYTYEQIAKLTMQIKYNWECDRRNGDLGREELAYIQSYAYRYMKEHYGR